MTEGTTVTLFLCGDVMTGRGIDQVLPHPSDPAIHEPYTTSALDYVELAEAANGPIPRPVDFGYVWGDALSELDSRSPCCRIANIETSITTSRAAEPKGINYRMHPRNVGCLLAARLDCCVLANNHILDWGVPGLVETLDTLSSAAIPAAGAGRDSSEAARPAVASGSTAGRVLVFAFGSTTSGIPAAWAAREDRPGVQLLPDLTEGTAAEVADGILAHRRSGDLVVLSVHWGGNWGYEIPRAQRDFAHTLIESGAVDVVHGHSSHHPKAIERYRGRLILYGCGDFVNDYEGIGGHEEFRPDLALGYFATLDAASGGLMHLSMVPFRSVRFRLQRASLGDTAWLQQRLDRESVPLGAGVRLAEDGALELAV